MDKRIKTKWFINFRTKIIKSWLTYLYEAGLITKAEFNEFNSLTAYVDQPVYKPVGYEHKKARS